MSDTDSSLFKKTEAEYGESYRSDYLEMHKDYVASADQISDRRHKANTFFLSVNSLLLAATGYLTGDNSGLLWLVGLAGATFSYTWMQLIRSYRTLNTAKFKVIHELEENLPFSAYDREWELAERGKVKSVHVPFGKIEMKVPAVFVVLHLVVFLVNFVSWIR